MTYVILLLLALAFWHWIYESVLAPSFRQVMKLELRALQAELASLEGRSLDPRCRGAFQALSDSLGTLGLFMNRLDVVTLAAVEVEIRRNPGLRELAESRAALFQSCDVKVLRDLRNRSLRLAARAVAVQRCMACLRRSFGACPHRNARRTKTRCRGARAVPVRPGPARLEFFASTTLKSSAGRHP